MNLPLFLSRRIYRSGAGREKVSRPAMRIATAGVAAGIAVMIITVCVVIGFKHAVRDKVIGFGSHIQVMSFLTMQTDGPYPMYADDSLMSTLAGIEGIAAVSRYALAQGILKTDADYIGMTFKGVGEEYDMSFIASCLTAGECPSFSDSLSSNAIVLSRTVADKLCLSPGDRVFAYFVSDDNVRTRRFTVRGIYQTNMSRFDDNVCFTDLNTTRRLNGWMAGQCSGAELTVHDFSRLETTAKRVAAKVNATTDRHGGTLTSQTIYEAYPGIFSWLELLDINVYIILALMVCVAVFTMASGLLIIILERTQMIGTLKALGATNATVRQTFLWLAAFIISRGLLLGDAAAIALVLFQRYTGAVALDPEVYYVSEVPVEIDIPLIVLLNVATLVICVSALVAPSYLVSHIAPAKTMKYL